MLRSLQEIQPDFVEEAKAQAGLWSQGKKKMFQFSNRFLGQKLLESALLGWSIVLVEKPIVGAKGRPAFF
jgi:hypothetical protein